jgi:hypothetical protein
MNGNDESSSRRDILLRVGRYAILGAICLLSGRLLIRDSGKCRRTSIPCNDCSLLAHCRQERAGAARNQRGKTSIDRSSSSAP